MKRTRRPRRTLAGLTAVVTLSAVLVSGSIAMAGVQRDDHGDDDVDDDTAGADSLVTVQADGEYEPCTAYFGYGKVQPYAVDLVSFDVDVDPPGPEVGDGVDVVLHVETTDDTIVCSPVEVTEAEWADVWADYQGDNPEYPGPGHYPYPSVPNGSEIDGAAVTAVAYQVVGIPDGYTLVSPPEMEILEAVESDLVSLPSIWPYVIDFLQFPYPGLTGVIEDAAGGAAAQAWVDAATGCPVAPTDSPELGAAIGALLSFIGSDSLVPATCTALLNLNLYSAIVLSGYDTIANVESITLQAPPAPPTPPDPPGPPDPPAPPAPNGPDGPAREPAAAAVAAAPSFTG